MNRREALSVLGATGLAAAYAVSRAADPSSGPATPRSPAEIRSVHFESCVVSNSWFAAFRCDSRVLGLERQRCMDRAGQSAARISRTTLPV